MSTTAKSVVECIWNARKSKTPDEEISVQLAKFGLSPEQISHVFEMVEFSLNRAFMETSGGIHTADYDDDPYFVASLNRARQQFPVSRGVRRERLIVRSAVAIAVVVGLFALGAVVYYVIDLLRSSH
jgi:hypothetical protein